MLAVESASFRISGIYMDHETLRPRNQGLYNLKAETVKVQVKR